MCSIFKGFESFTTAPQLKPTYYLAGETDKQYRARQRRQQREEAEHNREWNTHPWSRDQHKRDRAEIAAEAARVAR